MFCFKKINIQLQFFILYSAFRKVHLPNLYVLWGFFVIFLLRRIFTVEQQELA